MRYKEWAYLFVGWDLFFVTNYKFLILDLIFLKYISDSFNDAIIISKKKTWP